MSSPSLPTFLKYLPECRVILCRRHGCTFTSQDLGVHLKIFHGYSSRRGNHVSAAAHELGAASEKSEVIVPVNGSPANSNLNSYQGHQCQVVSDCQWLGVGKKAFQDHLQGKHGIDSGTGWAPHRQVILQCLFARSISPAYFVVGKRGPIMTEIAPRDTGEEHDQPADRGNEGGVEETTEEQYRLPPVAQRLLPPVEHKRKRGDLPADDSFEEPGSKRRRGMKRELDNKSRRYLAVARSSGGNAQAVKDYFSPAKSSTSSHAVTASIHASSSSPSPTAHPNSPVAKYFANTIFRAEQQDTDVVDNIHICIASDLIEPSNDISESKMGPKDVNFSLYRSILRNAGLLNDQICLICYVDSKGQRRGIYTQSMFVAAVEFQINQAEANHMITFHGCASLSPKIAKKALPYRASVVSGRMD